MVILDSGILFLATVQSTNTDNKLYVTQPIACYLWQYHFSGLRL